MRDVGTVNFPAGISSAIAAGDGGCRSRLQPALAARAGRPKKPSKPPAGTFTNEGKSRQIKANQGKSRQIKANQGESR
jgi:hypothetical protein